MNRETGILLPKGRASPRKKKTLNTSKKGLS